MAKRNTEALTPTLLPATDAPQALMPAPERDDVALMFERFAKDPAIDVDKLERLMAMVVENQKRQAEMAFNSALGRAAKNIKAAVTDDFNPQTKSGFASYPALDAAARPHYTQEGLSLTFKTERCEIPDYITVVCLAKHEAGHTERYAIDLPADGKGAKGGDVMTRTHATGSAVTYGMRYLLKMVFNIPIKDKSDDDGEKAGKPVTVEQMIPPPAGYETWFEGLEAVAIEGMPKFTEQWSAGTTECRAYLVTTNPMGLAHIRKQAEEATPKPVGAKR